MRIVREDSSVSQVISALWTRALLAKGYRVTERVVDDLTARLSALTAGSADVLLAYNGEMISHLDADDSDVTDRKSADAVLKKALPAGLVMLNSAEGDDKAVFAVTARTAAKYGLKSISDLPKAGATVTVAGPDSLATSLPKGLASFYGLKSVKVITADFGGKKTIAALTAGTATAGLFANSQYQLSDGSLTVLDDPKAYFLPQNPLPLFAKEPASVVSDTLNAVQAEITTKDLRTLRKEVLSSPISDVADAWLSDHGLT